MTVAGLVRRRRGSIAAIWAVGLLAAGSITAGTALEYRGVVSGGAADPIADGLESLPDDTPVLVLGGERERMALALTLPGVADGARDLIASAGAADDLEALGGDCDAPRVRCVDPVPATTRGEARLAARLAAAEGWTAVTVVTSWWHVHRASLHLDACLEELGVAVTFVPAGDPDVLPGPLRLLEEVVGSLDARLRPECADGGS